eukprot:m.31024 g.31024  ORF g.31024 m.31024 type:complete len:109 (-) comp9366_c0_seq2:1242-1568(-)
MTTFPFSSRSQLLFIISCSFLHMLVSTGTVALWPRCVSRSLSQTICNFPSLPNRPINAPASRWYSVGTAKWPTPREHRAANKEAAASFYQDHQHQPRDVIAFSGVYKV